MIRYLPSEFDQSDYNNLKNELLSLKWCRPPSGIPGNKTPRYVSVLGDGEGVYGNTVSYPMFQSCKDCLATYQLNPLNKVFKNVISKLKLTVKKIYGKKAINIDQMFNVAVCNYYSESTHRINSHRDDERWLEKNELNSKNLPVNSIIASITIYPDLEFDQQPSYFRNFEIYDDEVQKWNKIDLENNSILFFSNHEHRCKQLSKKLPNIRRINVTFRTITKGLLGMVGYSNFYRYMSLPIELSFTESKYSREKIQYFLDSIEQSNKFCQRINFSLSINISNIEYKSNILKKNNIDYLKLPKYVKPLCSIYNLQKYTDSLYIQIHLKF